MGGKKRVPRGHSLVAFRKLRKKCGETSRVVSDLIDQPDALLIRILFVTPVETTFDDVVVGGVCQCADVLVTAWDGVAGELESFVLLDRVDRMLSRHVRDFVSQDSRQLGLALDETQRSARNVNDAAR